MDVDAGAPHCIILPHCAGSEPRSSRRFDISFAELDKDQGQHKSLTTTRVSRAGIVWISK
jgi:hypothetical protein